MKPPLRVGSPDDFQTPPEALTPLYPYLKKEWVIWEPACGKGNLVRALGDNGFGMRIATDILTGFDFLTMEPHIIDADGIRRAVAYDCIITNPPFRYKQAFLERCYSLGKPFALLLPLTTFETGKRQALFKKFGAEVIFFDRRINFETPNKISNSSAWFATAWFTHGLNIGQALTFTTLTGGRDNE